MNLIVVYNAKSTKINALVGYAHKVISPSTYSCNLCKLTHSNLGERKEWTTFIKTLDAKIDFYHINEFEDKYHQHFEYPVVLVNNNNKFKILLDHLEIDKLTNVSDLIQKINEIIQ